MLHAEQDDGSVQVDESKVNEMLARRMQAKMGRDFDTADRIRDELRAMNVEVYDKEKTWTLIEVGIISIPKIRERY